MTKAAMPNLFVVGAAKAGTTSLWHILKQHPDIFVPPDEYMKEPCFFTRLTGVEDPEQYFGLFKDGKGYKYKAEVCTAYLSDPDAAKALHDFNPNAKIVIVLRNPVQRAYSLYNWMVQEGLEYCSSFERALDMEATRRERFIPNFWEPMYRYDYFYRSTGRYPEQIQRFVNLFGQTDVFIGLFEDFISSQQTFLDDLCSFLSIRRDFSYRSEPKNQSVRVDRPWLAFMLRKLSLLAVRIKGRFRQLAGQRSMAPHEIEEEVKRWVRHAWSRGKPQAPNVATSQALYRFYADDYAALERSFGLNLDGWRNM